jgi:RHS repeat-associated protein
VFVKSYGPADNCILNFEQNVCTISQQHSKVRELQRVEGGLTYTQAFDAENRLISVTVNGQTTQFIYDGSGSMVKKVLPDGSRTIYIGGIYEVKKNASGTVTGTTTYYPAAGAMRMSGSVYYILGDQLGSTSVVIDASGVKKGEQRYYPFGETRSTTGTLYTDRLFTGQQEISGLGLYNYKARFYDPALGRFVSPDTITPGGPQGLNRYSYSNNNPTNYADPSGHMATECGGQNDECDSTTQDKADYEYWRQRQDALKCQNGNSDLCSYAENHPVDTIVSSVTALTGLGAMEYAILGGGLASTIDGVGWQIAQACSTSVVCWSVTGAGGAGAASARIIGNPQATSDPSHAMESTKWAEELSRRPNVQDVFLNKTIKTITNGQVPSNLRPDIAAAYTTGSYSFMEIVIRSQSMVSQI